MRTDLISQQPVPDAYTETAPRNRVEDVASMYPKKHYRLCWGGPFFVDETWQAGLRLWVDWIDEATMVEMSNHAETHVANFATALASWHSDADTGVSNGALLSWVKLNGVTTLGKQDPTCPTTEYILETPAAGTASPYPPQVCGCMSWSTEVSRGRAHAGRTYYPFGALGTQSDGRMSQSIAQGIATAAQGLVMALGEIDWGVNATPLVWCMSDLGSGAMHQVTGVRVGRVWDTQQRRRRSLNESYVTQAINQSA